MYAYLSGMYRFFFFFFTVGQLLSSSSQEMSNSEVIISSSSRQVVPGSQQLHCNQETMVWLHTHCVPAGSMTRLCLWPQHLTALLSKNWVQSISLKWLVGFLHFLLSLSQMSYSNSNSSCENHQNETGEMLFVINSHCQNLRSELHAYVCADFQKRSFPGTPPKNWGITLKGR